MSEERDDPFFPMNDLTAFVRTVVAGAGPAGMTEDEITRIVDWARGVRVDYAIYQTVATGQVIARWPEDASDVLFHKAPATMPAPPAPAAGRGLAT